MSEQTNDWQKEDFLALLLLYASRADLNISDEERQFMSKLCGEGHCAKAKAYSESRSDYEIIERLRTMKEDFFKGAEGTAQLHSHLVALFQADDDFSHLEHSVMHGLERLW